jgi:hypothetical protein
MMGTNDAQNVELEKRIYKWGDSSWTRLYAERVDSFTLRLLENLDHVYWIGMPPMRKQWYHERMQKLNEIIETELLFDEYATYVSTNQLLCSKDGSFSQYIDIGGVQRKIRLDDGIHVNRYGGQLIVGRMYDLIESNFDRIEIALDSTLHVDSVP